MEIERGGTWMKFDVTVQDLHSISPDRYLMAGGAKMNNLSYQLARQFALPVSGVYLCEPGGMFKLESEDQGWIISSLNAIPTPDLDSFIQAFRSLKHRDQIPVTYYSIGDVHTKNVVVVHVDRHWAPFRLAVRNDKTGLWDFTDLNEGQDVPEKIFESVTVTFPELDESLGPARSIFHSLVRVRMFLPCSIEGYPKSRVSFYYQN